MPDVHQTPEVRSDQRVHVLDQTCWCKPKIMRRRWDGNDLVIHRAEAQQFDGEES